MIKTNTTTSSMNSEDPINLGDKLRYKDLTDKIISLETTVAEMKEMMKQTMELSRSHPST
ncbi:hypothetical protein Hanom_Chr01g00053761 [Helianthus anomalus]